MLTQEELLARAKQPTASEPKVFAGSPGNTESDQHPWQDSNLRPAD